MGVSRFRSMVIGGALVVSIGSIPALPATAGPPPPFAPAAPMASAVMKNQQGLVVGQVSFYQLGGSVQVRANLAGLEPRADFHGMHIHTNGVCDGDFTSAGGHWNPLGANHGDHAGDLVVLYADNEGRASSNFVLDTFTVSQLLSDDGGVAVIVHGGRDNYANVPDRYSTAAGPGPDATTKATGDAGSRYACGVVTAARPAMGGGYWLAGGDGGVFTNGSAPFAGSLAAAPLRSPVVAMSAAPGRAGYYLITADGGVFTFGAAPFAGSAANLKLHSPVVGMAVPPSDAVALLRDQLGLARGTVTFTQLGNRVGVNAYVTGLSPLSEFHGFHIHANGRCEGDFVTSAGGHWNPQGVSHGDHQGDLPVLYADAAGVARGSYTVDAFSVGDMLNDDGGVAVIVHAARDNFANIPARYTTATGAGPDATTLAVGDAGGRAACGVVRPTGQSPAAGYWLAAADGGVFAYGDAPFLGAMGGTKLAQPVVAIAPSPTGEGYRLAAADGGVFTFGDSQFFGSMGGTALAQPIVGMAATPSGRGYVLVAKDGGVFAFGDATYEGGTAGLRLRAPIVGVAMTDTGHGYWLFGADGGVFAFGEAEFQGAPTRPPVAPVVAGAAHAG